MEVVPLKRREGPATHHRRGRCPVRRRRRSAREALDELAETRVREVAVREDRPPVGSPGDDRPGDGRHRVVPGEAELVAPVVLVRDEVDELQRLEGEEAVGDAGRDRHGRVGRHLAELHEGARPRAVEERTDVDERDRGAAARDDPVVELAAVEVEDLFIVLLPVVFWDIFKRAMPYIASIPTIKFYRKMGVRV